jgi:hypothetical protein
MELIDVLRHSDPPRTEHFLEIPSTYGTLRLDIVDPGAALLPSGMTSETANDAQDRIDKARAKAQGGDAEGALHDLIEVVTLYPYSVDGCGALFDYYWDRGNRDETIYYARQLIAIDPRYRFMTMLGKELGRAGRYDEALILQAYLWETRQKARSAEAYNAACDYLITLGRAGDPKKMIEVARQAINEMGNDSALVYQYIYAHILDKQYAEARTLLNNVLPNLKGADPLYSRFMEMSNVVDGLMSNE